MELQITLDVYYEDEAVRYCKEISEFAEIIEIGTPLVLGEGFSIIEKVKRYAPNSKILFDMKLADAGEDISQEAFKRGADIVTILGFINDSTIVGAINAANKAGKEVMVDMIGIKDKAARAKQLDELGAHYICIHTGADEQAEGISSLESVTSVKQVLKNAKLAVAGGINEITVLDYVKRGAEAVIVGGAIYDSANRRATAKSIKDKMKGATD